MVLHETLTEKKALLRIAILTGLFVAIGTLIFWDHARVVRDFTNVKALLSDTRNRALREDKILVVQFSGNAVTVMDKETGKVLDTMIIRALSQVNYDTILGDDTIVFDGHGTSAWNKRVHGGDIRLKSWLGFRKNIAVNCTGLVTEGVCPGEF